MNYLAYSKMFASSILQNVITRVEYGFLTRPYHYTLVLAVNNGFLELILEIDAVHGFR
jgi:hypothetical protein